MVTRLWRDDNSGDSLASFPSSLVLPRPAAPYTMATTKEWSTESFLTDVRDAARPNAMIILNTPLPHHHLFAKLWDACTSHHQLI